jgi:hypothetical protein
MVYHEKMGLVEGELVVMSSLSCGLCIRRTRTDERAG